MARIITARTFQDSRGSLSVLEKEVGFPIQRVFYIYGVTKPRGGHGHKRTKTALISVHGTVVISGQGPQEDFEYRLDHPSKVLLLEADDWHEMHFGPDSVLLVLASTEFQSDDYVYEKPRG